MNFLAGWKLYAAGGVIIVTLILLLNHVENNGIREDVAREWRDSIKNAQPTIITKTEYVPVPEIKGSAKSKRVWSPDLIQNVRSNNDIATDKCDSLAGYYEWLLQDYTVYIDTADVEIDITAKPRSSDISYVLRLPPKEKEVVTVTKHVLEPQENRTWLVGFSLEYFNREPGIGAFVGIKPITVGASYFKNSPLLWRVGIQWEF